MNNPLLWRHMLIIRRYIISCDKDSHRSKYSMHTAPWWLLISNTHGIHPKHPVTDSNFHENHIFQCMGKICCMEFQRHPLKFLIKYLVLSLKDVFLFRGDNLRARRFKSRFKQSSGIGKKEFVNTFLHLRNFRSGPGDIWALAKISVK